MSWVSIQELARRCDTLIRLVEKENEEVEAAEREERKKSTKKTSGSRVTDSSGGAGGGSTKVVQLPPYPDFALCCVLSYLDLRLRSTVCSPASPLSSFALFLRAWLSCFVFEDHMLHPVVSASEVPVMLYVV